MGAIASQITSLTIVYSAVYSDADQRKYQSSASLAFVRVIHRGPVNSPHKWPVTRKICPLDDVIMLIFLVLLIFQRVGVLAEHCPHFANPHLEFMLLAQSYITTTPGPTTGVVSQHLGFYFGDLDTHLKMINIPNQCIFSIRLLVFNCTQFYGWFGFCRAKCIHIWNSKSVIQRKEILPPKSVSADGLAPSGDICDN